MKNKLTRMLVMTAFMISPLFFNSGVNAQTAGTMTFTVTTTFTGGGWGNRHNFVVWIENSSAAFVKTRILYGGETDHLLEWSSKTPSMSTVDATTGSTKNANPYTYSGIIWIGNDLTGLAPNYTLLADGTYTVAMELAWGSSKVLGTGRQIYRVSFTKGPSPQTVTPANQTNFTNMTLQWTPLGVGITENNQKFYFNVTPNPATSQSTINYSINEASNVGVKLYDINGNLVDVIFDGKQDAGNHSMPLSLKGKLAPGIYFVKMYTGNSEHTERIMVK